jgi:ketosteroid isomerase-like protein
MMPGATIKGVPMPELATHPTTSDSTTSAASPAAVFGRLVRGVGDRRWEELPSLYAEQTHVVHPHDPARAAPLLTREELRTHFLGGAAILDELRFEPAAVTVHETADPEVVVGEFEYRGVVPGTGEPFAIPNIFVIRVRDGQIIESRDYVDHVEIARILGRLDDLAAARQRTSPAAGPAPSAGAAGWLRRAQQHYEDAAFDDDVAGLAAADQELDAVEAGLTLARGRIMHARFLAGSEPDDDTRATFERAAALYRKLGDARGEAESLFWTATFHQAVRGDHQSARPLLDRAGELATAAGDTLTLSYVARHLGFADAQAGRLDLARQRLTESLTLRRELGFERGVAAALLALAEFEGRHGDPGEAAALLDEAEDRAEASRAAGIERRIGQLRDTLTA